MIMSLNNLDYLLKIQCKDKKTTYGSPRTRKHNEISLPKTRLAASFCHGADSHLYQKEAVFMALVRTRF